MKNLIKQLSAQTQLLQGKTAKSHQKFSQIQIAQKSKSSTRADLGKKNWIKKLEKKTNTLTELERVAAAMSLRADEKPEGSHC